MEPQIRYVRSADGTNIAFATAGAGPPLVTFRYTALFGDMMAAWALPEARARLERAAQRNKLVQYDHRGGGLSERAVEDISLDAHAGDLSAVVDAVGAERVSIWAGAGGGMIAVRYTVQHPTRISHLVLANAVARGRDLQMVERRRVIAPIFDYDYELWVQTMLVSDLGLDQAARLWSAIRASPISKEMLTAMWREQRGWDVTPELSAISCATLVLYGASRAELVDIDAGRQLAASIPGARFHVAPPGSMGFSDEQLNAALPFLADEHAATEPHMVVQSGTAIILFADIVDSTALTERMGDAAFRAKARDLDVALRGIISESGGATIEGKLLGDGVLATFPAASQAIDAALRCGVAGADGGLQLHLGLHAGDVLREEGPGGQSNVYGGAVNIASRISGLSAPGEVLVSRTVADLARTSAGVVFEDRGEFALKGVGDAVRVYAVRVRDQA